MKETLCKHCDHFIEENDLHEHDKTFATHVHMENGQQEFDHDAEPGETLESEEWDKKRPDLFKHHPDGAIGPNSFFHSRHGKDDGLWYVDDRENQTLANRRKGVAEMLFSEYDFKDDSVADVEGWNNEGDTFKCVFFLEDVSESRRCEFHVTFKPGTTQVVEMDWE